MFVRETVRQCSTCDETTPHSRRVVAVPLLVGLLALAVGAALFLSGGAWRAPGVFVGLFGLVWLGRDRGRFWSIACERCRGKRRHELARTKPKLDGNTEITF